VFGDSITFGLGDNLNRGWCGRLRKDFENKDYYNFLQNLGICGDTTTTLLKRIKIESKARIKFLRHGDRSIIIIAIGINDSLIYVSNKKPMINISMFKKNIHKLINISKSLTEEVLFIGLTPVNETICENYEGTQFSNNRINDFNNIIQEVCNQKDIPFFNMFEEFSKLNYLELLDDGLHPNSKGYDKMYGLIKEFLIKEKIIEIE